MDVFVVDAVRTPIGARNGLLADWHPVDLLAATLVEAAARSGLRPGDIDQIVGACGSPIGEQALNVTRNAVLAAGWPETIAASTVDAHAAGAMFAIGHCLALVQSGLAPVCLAAGVESMTRVPSGATAGMAVGKPFGPSVHARYEAAEGLVPPGVAAERLARSFGLSRAELDAYAESSYEKVGSAGTDEIAGRSRVTLARQAGASLEVIEGDQPVPAPPFADLVPSFTDGGLITAGNRAFAADGAAVLVLAGASAVDNFGLRKRARVLAFAAAGADPLAGDPGYATASQALADAGLTWDELDRVEVHEDSAATPLTLAELSKLDISSINRNGGAIGRGEPIGAAGALLVTSLMEQLERNGGGQGLAVLAGSAGSSAAIVIRSEPT